MTEFTHLFQARLSRQLVELERNIPLDKMSLPSSFQDVEDLRMESIDSSRLLGFYRNMGFKDLERRIAERLRFSHKYVSVKRDAGTEQNAARNVIFNTRREPWSGDCFTTPKQFRTPPEESFDDVPF